MRTAADYFGLMAYLFVMYGGLPDRNMLWAVDAAEQPRSRRRRSHLRLIKGSPEPPSRRLAPARAATAEDEAAA